MRTKLKSTIALIFGLGLVFGLLIAANLWLRGLSDTYAEIAGQATDGRVILLATTGTEREIGPDDAPVLMDREEMIQDLEQNGGKIIGNTEFYGQYGSVVVPTDLLSRDLSQLDLSNAPEDATPVLISTYLGEQLLDTNFPSKYTNTTDKVADYRTYRAELLGQTFTDHFGVKYYIAGFAPTNFHTDNLSFSALERANVSLLNPLLQLIRFPDTPTIVLDQKSGNNKNSDIDSLLVSFKNPADAYYYFRHGHGIFPNFDAAGRKYYIDIVAGMSPEITYLIRGLENIIGMITAIILIITLIILALKLRGSLKQNPNEIAKYRKQGVSWKQIRASFVCYYFISMIFATVLAFGVGLLIVFIFNIVNQDLLNTQFLLGFSLDAAPRVMYYGFGIRTLILLILIPITGVLAAWLGTGKINEK